MYFPSLQAFRAYSFNALQTYGELRRVIPLASATPRVSPPATLPANITGFLVSVRSLDHGYRGQITCMYSCSHEDSLPYHSNIVMSQSSKIPPNILIDSCTPFWSLSRHHKECAVVRTTLPPLILNERGWRSLRRKQSCQGDMFMAIEMRCIGRRERF
jgi:hypothetical protein